MGICLWGRFMVMRIEVILCDSDEPEASEASHGARSAGDEPEASEASHGARSDSDEPRASEASLGARSVSDEPRRERSERQPTTSELPKAGARRRHVPAVSRICSAAA